MQSDWIFGYGSILDDFKPSNHSSVFLCDLNHPSYKRCWNFRSATGFTAVGIEKKATPSNDKTGNTMCGVLFRIGTTGCSQHNDASFITQSTKSLAALDAREKGYKRVNINPKYFTLAPEATCVTPLPSFKENDRCWLYIPVNPQSATKDYPICQTYLDTILRGCLKWGKENLAQRWVKETIGWSRFYLNDAPLSRRPWLYRQFFCEIDGVLKQFSDRTFFFERRHPEEFSAKWLSTLVGFWGVPPRNPYFIGREHELEKIVDTFQKSETQHGRGHIGVTMIETVGLGGVGKTQVAAEYCYRHYFAESNKRAKDEMKKILGNKYSLIMWWRAESAEVLAFDVRRFAEDTGIVVHGVRNEEVVREVMCRLYQTTKPWLMVLDNLTDKATLDAYLPRGASSSGGHILVTSREFLSGFHNDNRVELRCFNMNESLDLLRKAGGEHLDIDVPYYEERENENHRWTSGNNNTKITKYVDMSSNNSVSFTAGQVLSQRLGHLPLALSVAAAYMRQCDVDVTSYLRILNSSGNGLSGERLPGYPMGVEDSLMLSLQRIRENEEDVNQLSNQNYCNDTVSSRDVLDTLCYLYPDDISKDIVSSIVGCLLLENNMIHSCVSSINFTKAKIPERANSITRLLSGGIGGLCLAGLSYWYLMSAGKNTPVKSRQNLLGVTALVSATTIALFAIDSQLKMNRENANSLSHKNEQQNQKHRHPLILQNNKRESEATKKKKNHANICSNRIWLKLKKYSLLTVQRGHGSMHRLLQQLLRTTSDHDAVRSLATCIWSIKQLWSFDPADASTWKEAGNVVDHIKCVGNQVRMVLEKNEKIEKNEKNSNNVNNDILLVELQINTGTLLTESALYMSMALSRFREARDVLDLALQVQRSKTEIALLNGSNILQKRLSRGLAHTMHTAGKVSRYCGEYDTAHAFLTDALAIRGGRQKPSMDVAATLHELGVLMIKRGVWSEAQVLLEESLSMKRTISNNDQANIDNDKKECAPSSAARFSEEAATLHQLAVVAMNGKPRRLSKAEELLREALVVMKKGPFGVGGRAATLSKLAQVLERWYV
jgi:tetratricopeptide (TPR) repeat protein